MKNRILQFTFVCSSIFLFYKNISSTSRYHSLEPFINPFRDQKNFLSTVPLFKFATTKKSTIESSISDVNFFCILFSSRFYEFLAVITSDRSMRSVLQPENNHKLSHYINSKVTEINIVEHFNKKKRNEVFC